LDKLGWGFTLSNPLEEVDIEDGSTPSPTFVNKNLKSDSRDKVIRLLQDYVDYFAWSHSEKPRLSQELVEHRLPIKPSFRSFK
jgi:hypothetical protein